MLPRSNSWYRSGCSFLHPSIFASKPVPSSCSSSFRASFSTTASSLACSISLVFRCATLLRTFSSSTATVPFAPPATGVQRKLGAPVSVGVVLIPITSPIAVSSSTVASLTNSGVLSPGEGGTSLVISGDSIASTLLRPTLSLYFPQSAIAVGPTIPHVLSMIIIVSSSACDQVAALPTRVSHVPRLQLPIPNVLRNHSWSNALLKLVSFALFVAAASTFVSISPLRFTT